MRRATIRAAPASAEAHFATAATAAQADSRCRTFAAPATPPACLRPCPSVAVRRPSARPAMIALPMTLLALVALAAAAPATRPSDADPIDAATAVTDVAATAPTAAPATGGSSPLALTLEAESAEPSAAASPADPAPASGGATPLKLTFEAELESEEEDAAPEGELGAGEEMEGAENIVFKPLFRYRERGGFRRRVRASNRRRDANYRRTYAARFPHHRYRSSPKRRNALHTRHQVLF